MKVGSIIPFVRRGALHGSTVLLLSVGVPLLASTARAQSDTEDSDSRLEEVIVTAQKRAENVQEIPTSVSVISQQQLQSFGGSQLMDIARMVPSLQPPTGVGTRAPAIRGISSFAASQGVPTAVGIIVDDVPQSNWSTLANELSDVERVEVLAGPQFTLSGRNAAGGLVNIVTRAPSDVWTGSLDALLSEDHERSFRGFLSGPINDGAAFSVSAFSHQFGGNVLNAGTRTWQNSYDNQGIRVKTRFALGDSLTLTLTGYYVTQDRVQQSTGVGGGLIIFADPAARWAFDTQGRTPAQLLLGQEIGSDTTTVNSPRNTRHEIRDRGGSARLDYDFANATLSSLTSIYRSNQPMNSDVITFDYASTLVPVLSPTFDGYARLESRVDELTQEFRLVSSGDGAFKYVLGAIYTDTENKYAYRRVLFPFDSDRTTNTKSAAMYGRGTLEFVTNNFITLGLRGQHDKLRYDWQFNEIVGAQPAGLVSGDSDYTFAAGDISYQHKFTPDLMAYITYTQGETGEAYDVEDNVSALGTANLPGGTFGALSALPSEKVKSGEIGVKSEWLDGHLILNLSAFYADYQNYQLQSLVLDQDSSRPPTLKLLSIGAVNTRGVELSGQAFAKGGLNIGFAGAYIDAKLTKFPNAACYSLQTAAQGCINGVQPSLAGAGMPNSPKFKANLSVDKRFETSDLPFNPEVGLNYRYQSSVNFDVLQNPYSRMAGFGILNLHAGIRSSDEGWNVRAFVNNVFDKRYYASLSQSAIWNRGPVIAAQLPRDANRYFGVMIGTKF